MLENKSHGGIHMKTALFAIGLLITTSAFGADESAEAVAYVPTYSAQPCSFWTYNMNGGGYLCSSYTMGISIPDGNAVNQELNALSDRVRRLETALAASEAKKATK